jgi:hypothetical protein
MKFIFSYIGLVLLLGCQSAQKIPVSERCANRDVASTGIQCSVALSVSQKVEIPSADKMSEFFKELEAFDMTQWQLLVEFEKGYSSPSATKSFVDLKEKENDIGKPLKSISTGQILAQRRELGESTGKILTDLGYRVVGDQLMPPRNLALFYSRLMARLYSAAESANIDKSDVLLPAFLFRRNNDGKHDSVFVRPGIDPLPKVSDGWVLDESGTELNTAEFHRMIQERKFLLGSRMFFHDMGHFVDFIENPQYMRAYRLFIEKKNAMLTGDIPPSVQKHVLGQVAFRGDLERYFSEWIYLPSFKNTDKIRQLIGNISLDKPSDLNEVTNFYRKEKSNTLLKLAKRFLKNRYVLFSSHGGGARDWSVDRYLTPEYIIKGFQESLLVNAGAVAPNRINEDPKEYGVIIQNSDQAYRMYEAPGLFQRLEYLVDTKEGRSVPPEIQEALRKMFETSGMQNFDIFIQELIAIHLGGIHFRVQSALNLNMTPDQIAQDTAFLYEKKGYLKYAQTNTFKYFSTYKPYSIQWYLGADIARPMPGFDYIEWPQ